MKRNSYVSPKRTRQINLKTAALALFGSAATMVAGPVNAIAPFFNTVPVAQAGGPYTIHLGESLVVNGSTSFDPDSAPVGDFISSYQWDLGANGLYDGFGVTDTFTALELATAGIDAIGIYSLRLAVTDTFGGIGFQTTTIEVLAPAIAAVPEPGSLSLFGLGLGLVGALGLRRRYRACPPISLVRVPS